MLAMLSLGLAAERAGAQSCPLPDGTLGYAVTALSADVVDSAYLTTFARAAAYRWRVPSSRRGTHDGWERVANRLLTPEPRWADDWTPEAKHRAHLTLVVRRDGKVVLAGTPLLSGDRTFDRSLESIAHEPMPAAPGFPRLPQSFIGDSAVITLTFGDEPEPGAGVARFAAQQRPVRLVPGTLNIVAPREQGTPSARSRRATVKYDVTVDGIVARGSIEVLQSSDRELSRAIEEALASARFTPAQSDCRAIAQSVLQNFGR